MFAHTTSWVASNWVKLVVGVGTVGGLALLVSRTSKDTLHQFEQLTSVGNAALAQDRVLNVALSRMSDYASGDPSAFTCLVEEVAGLMLIDAVSPSARLLRYAEQHVRVIKRCVNRLHEKTMHRSNENAEVMTEFSELAQTVLNACDDRLFNLHQSFAS